MLPHRTGLRTRLLDRLRRSGGGRGLLLAYQLVRSAETRSVALLRLRRPDNLFQPFGYTEADRHPELFAFVRERLGDGPDRRLLSFGCSDGEEVFSLRRHFPAASIKGIDIDRRRIARCRQRLAAGGGDERIAFEAAGSAADERRDHYDAIFAMAVFRHGDLSDAPPRCDHLIRFADFERSVVALAACVRPGGLIVLRHASFRFGDTAAARAFRCVHAVATVGEGTPIYDRDNRLVPGATGDDGVYEKVTSGEGARR